MWKLPGRETGGFFQTHTWMACSPPEALTMSPMARVRHVLLALPPAQPQPDFSPQSHKLLSTHHRRHFTFTRLLMPISLPQQ